MRQVPAIRSTCCISLLAILVALIQSCDTPGSDEHIIDTRVADTLRIVLPESRAPQRRDVAPQVDSAVQELAAFARAHGWDSLVTEPFMDSVMIFDRKKDFDHQLLMLAGADTTMELPSTYCGALEARTLVVMSPGYYDAVYPDGREPHAWVKLLVHEMAHRLHVRILNGNEEAMGPIWFYEGFAIHAAGQLTHAAPTLDSTGMRAVMDDPERGSYALYGAVFNHFAQRHTLADLVRWAANNELERVWGRGPADQDDGSAQQGR